MCISEGTIIFYSYCGLLYGLFTYVIYLDVKYAYDYTCDLVLNFTR